jgi:diguanylate cyclase (GGDEF)-like protein
MTTAIRIEMKKIISVYTSIPLKIYAGQSFTDPFAKKSHNQIFVAIKEAYRTARNSPDLQSAKLMSEFKNILDHKDLNFVFQPIVSLNTGRTLGWEGLTRGPVNSYFQSPMVLFPFAEEAGQLFQLEKTCREGILEEVNFTSEEPESLLFININPHTINDPEFVKGETKKILHEKNLSPRNIVFEITERSSIQDFSGFKRTLEHYRNQGYLIAVDDAGSGYSSLQSIAEINPDFIKIDMSLVSGISNNPVKKALLETFVTFSHKINSEIIAEGIETAEELKTLVSLGVHYGQGYFLAKPNNPMPQPARNALEIISRQGKKIQDFSSYRNTHSLGDIVQLTPAISPNNTVGEVRDIFENEDSINGLVITNDNEPVGLIMRQDLYYHLSSKYGTALYSEKLISTIMDKRQLILDSKTPLALASQVAMSRNERKLYDYITVTDENFYVGTVSIQKLLDKITSIEMNMAKWANPLSGLPGNRYIEEELSLRIAKDDNFSVVYVDLDKFKKYNDYYGFEHGDKVLLFTAKLISKMVKKFGAPDDFVGHIGGDDFIFITHPDNSEKISKGIIKRFDRLISSFHKRKTDLFVVNISLAILDCIPNETTNVMIIAEKSAELKREAKAIEGSVYVRMQKH